MGLKCRCEILSLLLTWCFHYKLQLFVDYLSMSERRVIFQKNHYFMLLM